MAHGNLNNTAPQGVDILKSETNGEIYVINDVLSYYQRKLRVLGIAEAKVLAHYLFEPKKVNEAREVLHAIYTWRGLEPTSTNAKVVNNIIAARSFRNGNYRLVIDILEFLQMEDCNLNVTFLTLCCEDIPSKVTEEESMKEVHILLEKNEYNYNKVMDSLEAKQQAFDNQARLLDTVRHEMSVGFKAITEMINNTQINQGNTATSLIPPLGQMSDPMAVGRAFSQLPTLQTALSGRPRRQDTEPFPLTRDEPVATAAAAAAITVTAVVEEHNTAMVDTNANNPIAIAASTQPVNTIAEQMDRLPNDQTEPSTVIAPVPSAAAAAATAAAATAAEEVEQVSNENNLEDQLHTVTESLRDLSLEDISILEDGEIDEMGDDSNDRLYASVVTNIRNLPVSGGSMISNVNPLGANLSNNNVNTNAPASQGRMHTQSNSASRNSTSTNVQGNVNNNSGQRLKPTKSEFLVKNTKQITVDEEGDAGIPFSALREFYKYKAFITNLCPRTNIDTIKNHINSLLQVNALVKQVSPDGASYLSLIIFFTSDSDRLNLRMRGLWPNGTVIKQCISNNNRKRNGNNATYRNNQGVRGQGHRGELNLQGQHSRQRYGHSSSSESSRNRVNSNSSVQANADQLRLRQQWEDY